MAAFEPSTQILDLLFRTPVTGAPGMIDSSTSSPPWGEAWLRRLSEMMPLSEAAQDALRRGVQQIRHFSTREHIVRDGIRDAAVRVLASGFACRYKHLPDGRRQITALIVPGDICDYGFLSDSPVSQGVLALAPSSVGLVDLDRLGGVVEQYPEVMTAILRCGAIEQSATQELLVSLGGRNALHRVGHFLCEMHVRLGKAGLVRPDGSFDLPLTQSEIGEALGLSTVHVNRTVQMLRKLGLALWRDRTVTLPDPIGLARLCSFDPAYLQARQ
jgi:CRP-like cAMP-binding protein